MVSWMCLRDQVSLNLGSTRKDHEHPTRGKDGLRAVKCC